MAVILFTTTDVRGPRRLDFERLLASVRHADDLEIRHYVLLQNATEADRMHWRAAAPACCRIDAVPGRMSISAARNRMMADAVAEATPQDGDVVGFPDDDCWFADGFLQCLADLFDENARLGVLVCRVSLDPDPNGFDAGSVTPLAAHQAVRLATSNNMFFRGALTSAIGRFDPELGLGTASGGGEDTDYVIRAYLRAREAGLIDRPLVGHPVPDRISAARYFRGALIVLAYHARSSPALTLECFRKIFVGLYFTASGKMSLAGYRQALADGARAFGAKRDLAPARGTA